MMPVMDGFEVCRRIRSTPKIAEVPIVILTALDDHASLMQGIEAGADDFLTKPVDRYELEGARAHDHAPEPLSHAH
jgi:DNA-binding response OmpR family regulator